MLFGLLATTALSPGVESGSADPASLATLHPLLARDVEAFSPWITVDVPGFSGPCWQPEKGGREVDVIVCGSCPSSLDIGWELLRQGMLPEWGSVLALAQNSGRGQLRRPWLSPPGNVYAALRLPLVSRRPDLRPLIVAWSLGKALEPFLRREARGGCTVKWPNDLLFMGRKVGGILIEEREGAVIAGIGLNLVPLPGEVAASRDPWAPEAGTLDRELDPPVGPVSLWYRLLDGFRNNYEWIAEHADDAVVVGELESMLAWMGRLVEIRGPGGDEIAFDNPQGVVVGVSSDGALRVTHENGEMTLRSASVFLVRE